MLLANGKGKEPWGGKEGKSEGQTREDRGKGKYESG